MWWWCFCPLSVAGVCAWARALEPPALFSNTILRR
eukprot:gene7482-11348_t